MGYTTTFEGALQIMPPLTPEFTAQLNDRLDQEQSQPNIATKWCDWRVSKDGTSLHWSGAEKSYSMDEWLAELINQVFEPGGYLLNGEIYASGESAGDHWMMQVTDNKLEVKRGRVSFD